MYMCMCGRGRWVTNAPEVLEQFPDQQVFCSLSENESVYCYLRIACAVIEVFSSVRGLK